MNKLKGTSELPWWTWVLPFIFFHAGSHISMFFQIPSGSSLFYLPVPLSIILIHWWGLRILPSLIVNSFITALIWDQNQFNWWPAISIQESLCAFFSWYLFSYKYNGKAWLPDIYNLSYFILLGIAIPISINSIYIFALSTTYSTPEHMAMVWTADFASSFALTLPALYFITPVMEVKGLTIRKGSIYRKPLVSFRILRPHLPEIIISLSGLIFISSTLSFERYWFVYGIFTLYLSVRFGFENAIQANLITFSFAYFVPFITSDFERFSWSTESSLINVHLGMCMMSVTACITGRVITDLRNSEKKFNKQFKDLERTNKELDRFVYSASHDLSAPLKSLLGLINISRMEKNPERHIDYINRMETSILKLERFISEILDYSRNNRSIVSPESIQLSTLIDESIETLRFFENFNLIKIDTTGIQINHLVVDKLRIRIILNNLLSNAVKYHRSHEGFQPMIQISSELKGEETLIRVIDNGQGIPNEYLEKIFTMFYRGTEKSNGSGLGLYIAKEAAAQINGRIIVSSTYGLGSTFTIILPKSHKI